MTFVSAFLGLCMGISDSWIAGGSERSARGAALGAFSANEAPGAYAASLLILGPREWGYVGRRNMTSGSQD